MHLSSRMKDTTKGKMLQEMVRYDRLSVHQPPVSASLLALLRPHSVTCFRLLWSGHRRQVTVDFLIHGHALTVSWISNGHYVCLRPGHDLRSFFPPKMLCRRSDSLLVWVKFIYHAGDTSSCDMVVTVLRDVLSHLFLRLTAAHSSSNLFFSSIVVFFGPLLQESRRFDPCDLCHGNIRALFALSSSEVVSLMNNHSST